MITYQKGSLFDAPKDSLIAHACNCRGRWGSGIAKEFAARYPRSYAQYQTFCNSNGDSALGKSLVCTLENGHQVVCLFTSRGYGDDVDPPANILKSTKDAVEHLSYSYPDVLGTINMPKINSGLFRVPWDQTAEVLRWGNFDYMVWEP